MSIPLLWLRHRSRRENAEQAPVIEPLGARRGDEFVATYKFKWNGTSWPAFVVRWIDRRQWLAVMLDTTGQAYLYRQRVTQADEEYLATGSTASLSAGTWYVAKLVVDDSGGQRLGWGRHLAGQRGFDD